MAESKIDIRVMKESDIPIGMSLKNSAGWNQIEADWRRFLSLSPDGCFVAEIEGNPVGTVVTVILNGRCGWVAMVLVSPEFRRLGIGTAMLHHGIARLKSQQVDVIKLDATAMGREVYRPLGFQDEYGLCRMEGRGREMAPADVRAMEANDLGPVIEFDTPKFGVDRGDLIRALYRDSTAGIAFGSDGSVLGYVMVRKGSQAYQIGPLLGRDERTQEMLFDWAVSQVGDSSVFFDIPKSNTFGLNLATDQGFVVQREFTRMYLGGDPLGGNPDLVMATSGPEKG